MTNDPKVLAADKFLIDVHGERGRIGKTLVSNRIRDFLEARTPPLPVETVRIESRASRVRAREADPRIYIEDLAEARGEIGGSVAALGPVQRAISRLAVACGAVILDWPAGSSTIRPELLLATQAVARAAATGIDCVSCTVTTTDPSLLDQALETIAQNTEVAPDARQILVVNEVSGGPVARIVASSEQGRTWQKVKSASVDAIVRIPLIKCRAWELFESYNLEMAAAICGSTEELAALVGRDELVVAACQSHVAAWWEFTDHELARVFSRAANA